MRDLVRFWRQHYNAVSTNDNGENSGNTQEMKNTKSLDPKRSLSNGFSIVDSFFYQRKAGKRTRWPKCVFLLMTTGFLALTVAILVHTLKPYDLIFKWKLKFEENGEIFNLWAKPPVDLYIKIYLFNITNAEDFLAGRDKMRIEEVGPYVYREVLSHENITFNNNGTLSTIPKHPLIWQEELSEGHKEDDLFILPNIALLSIAQVAAEKSFFLRFPINVLIRQTNSQPLANMTAKEFMFGFDSPLTALGNQFLPGWITFEKVGLIDRMYDFEGDFETMFTGEFDPSIAGLYDTYKGSSNLPQWNGDHCSKISQASDGTKFKSFTQADEKLLFFRKSMCRPQRMVRVGNETQMSNLKAFKYVFEENALDNGAVDEKNKCFCREGKCLPRGLIDVTDCYYGFPIALSYPHFLDGDENLRNDVIGSHPVKEKHESFFMIEPQSGLPLTCHMRFQINMAMRDVSNMAHVEMFSNIIIPMVWFDITMPELPSVLQNRFNLYLNILPLLDLCVFYGAFIGGIVLLVSAVTKAALSLSSFVPSRKISERYNSNKFVPMDIYKPCEQKLKEPDNKCITKNLSYNTDLENGNSYELEQEIAISESEESDSEISMNPGHSRVMTQGNKSSYGNNGLSQETSKLLCEIMPCSTLIDEINKEYYQSAHDGIKNLSKDTISLELS